MKTNIGISKADTTKVITILSHYLSDSYYLYLKTHNFHWNVTGMHFQNLHKLFDDQYNALFSSLDEIAERIRSLGEFVPGSYMQMKELTCIKESKEIPNDREMLKILLDDHETIVRNLRNWIEEANQASDVGTGDFLTARIEEHEKTAWMLRSHLES
ncbi:Dps family protein [Fluviispira multicolorata]|uniref:DNA starvation/stationary phase protection protein n=1 Tax=Fluviispira multicolorata TaxID=2654512 RepID=A0A833N7P3_9BACT|nr:Dps family protein [Fluviispira multicolorata]KAB8033191.1 DNA starvation/stationary phase protection protein [Fluviispira multicolorata]